MPKFLHATAADNDRAMTIPRHFLQKQQNECRFLELLWKSKTNLITELNRLIYIFGMYVVIFTLHNRNEIDYLSNIINGVTQAQKFPVTSYFLSDDVERCFNIAQ